MKYNTTYTPTGSLKATIKFTDFIRKQLWDYLGKRYAITRILTPASLSSSSIDTASAEYSSRPITFDAGEDYRVGQLLMSDSNYLRSMALRLEITKREALAAENAFIWRDLPETPTTSISRHEITLLTTFADAENDPVRQAVADLYDLFFSLAIEAREREGINNIYPPYVSFITPQILENEYLDKDRKAREIEMVVEKDAFIMENPGRQTTTGHIHTNLPLSLYNRDNFYQIVLRDRVNTAALKVASVGEMAMGTRLLEQIANDAVLKQDKEYISMTESTTRLLEIKINLPRLVMALLGKGHIAEVQPGVYSDEEKVVKSKYKIDTY